MKNQYIKGDCFSVLPNVPDGSVDLIIGDLPFGVTDNAWDVVPNLEALWVQYKRVLKPTGIVLMFGTNPFDKQLYMSNPKAHRYDIIWVKNMISNPYQCSYKPLSLFENIGYYRFSNEKGTYNPQMSYENVEEKVRNRTSIRKGRNLTYDKPSLPYVETGERYPTNVIHCDYELDVLYFSHDKERYDSSSNQRHRNPTQKPVLLYEYLIKTYSNVGETVLDSFAGTATTAVACIGTNRNYICIEMDSAGEQYQFGIERIKKALIDRKQISILDSDNEIKERSKMIRSRLIELSQSQLTL